MLLATSSESVEKMKKHAGDAAEYALLVNKREGK